MFSETDLCIYPEKVIAFTYFIKMMLHLKKHDI